MARRCLGLPEARHELHPGLAAGMAPDCDAPGARGGLSRQPHWILGTLRGFPIAANVRRGRPLNRGHCWAQGSNRQAKTKRGRTMRPRSR